MALNSQGNSQRLVTIQVLRGFAALLVALGHATLESRSLTGYSGYFQHHSFNYGFGVDVFFVISGFIMMHTAGREFGTRKGQLRFLVSRLTRIVPLYWLLTSVTILMAFFVPSLVSGGVPAFPTALASYFFIPVSNVGGSVLPILPVGWTLNYEMFFYVLFFLSMAFPKRAGVLCIGMILSAFAVSGWLLEPQNPTIRFLCDSIVIEFCFGIGIALATSWLARFPSHVGFAVLAVGVLAFVILHWFPYPTPEWRFLFNGIPALMIVAGGVALDTTGQSWKFPLLTKLGDASYSLYLSHMFVIRILRALWNRAELPANAAIFSGVAIVSVSVFAIGLSKAFELPSYRYLKRKLGGKPLAST